MRGTVAATGEERGDLQASRTLAGHQGRAGRRADRSRGVGLGETGAFGGKLVQVGRVLILTAEAAEVVDAEVISEEDDEVGRGLLRGGRGEREQGTEE